MQQFERLTKLANQSLAQLPLQRLAALHGPTQLPLQRLAAKDRPTQRLPQRPLQRLREERPLQRLHQALA